MAYPVREAPPAGDTRKVTGLARFRGARAAQLLPRTRLSGPVPWVIAIMVALTVVAAAAALALSHLAGRVGGDLAGGATVQIVQADRGQRERQAVAARDALTRSAEVATVITRHSGPEVITIGHMKLFQWVTTVISTRVTMIGRFSGTTRCHSRRSVPAPSIRMASMSSEGMPRKFSRSRKIA